MATARSQAKWRDRVNKGKVKQNQICPMCGKPCRADSIHAPLHTKCWRKTEEGKKYMRLAKQKSRERQAT